MAGKTFALPRSAAAFVFGILFPAVILFQAYLGLASLGADVGSRRTDADLIKLFSEARRNSTSANDYALFSLLFTEQSNEKTMTNKQVMKVSVMQLGFAVSSVGIMLIILGFNDGGASGTTDISGVKFDFKSGSTGVVVFLAGAAMAAAGGVLKNDYTPVSIPGYVQTSSSIEYRKSLEAFESCRDRKDGRAEDCFYSLFQTVNKGALK